MLERIEHDEILEIRFNRPPVNALSPEFVQELSRTVIQAPRDGARGVVLSGRPGMFSAGLDIPALLALDEAAMHAFWKDFFGLAGAIACSSIPVVAAMTGHSPAGGAVLALFCDYRVMAEGEYRIGLNEVQVGLPLPPLVHAALVRQVGVREAERLAVGGLMLDAGQARDVGLVDELAPESEVVERARAWCGQLTQLPRTAMEMTRDLARADMVDLFERIDENDYRQMTQAWFSEETQQTMRALMERLKNK